MPRLRPLSEEECYLRCYGWVGSDDNVRVADPSPVEEAPPDPGTAVLTDRIRRAFEAALDAREPEAA